MKKKRAIAGMFMPLVFGALWVASILLSIETMPGAAPVINFGLYSMVFGALTLVGFITMIIGSVYIGKEEHLTHKEIFKTSRKLARKNVRKYLLGILLLFILQSIQNGLSDPNQPTTLLATVLIFLIGISYLRIDLGLKSISLSLIEEKATRCIDIFVDPIKFGKYLVAYFIIRITTVIGLILFVVPGIIVSLRLSMVPYLILEKKCGPRSAIKQSWEMTKGYSSNIFALNVIAGLINILGLLALIVGLFWTLPLFYIANAILYKKLLSHKK